MYLANVNTLATMSHASLRKNKMTEKKLGKSAKSNKRPTMPTIGIMVERNVLYCRCVVGPTKARKRGQLEDKRPLRTTAENDTTCIAMEGPCARRVK
jgi:hypothetical protein